MPHLRLITPADRTENVVRLTEGTFGCTHLVVVPGAARDPAGESWRSWRASPARSP
ncbi:hypothetical protein [Streptomyces sp. 11x1]|uniref:hypothetical protein n=1 Tax=Streptomyces sp. 11x1 TaxID=3038642 RepID=UPI0029304690|nr:hypothetical protein [Streptomyces sp. 11x1]WNZ14853.1 hypothetical protein P8T65_17585 [Streptomyces sp. 11x1]